MIAAAEPGPQPTTDGPADVEAPPTRRPLVAAALWGGVFVASLVVVAAVIRPFTAGPVAPDASASVLFWDRIVSGQRLEAFVNTTPKPLLTIAYGLAHSLTGDWRAVSMLAIAAAAAAATLGACLAHRVAGPLAGILAWVLLVSDADLLTEVSWAYGLPWATACLAAAGLALTARRPRYGIAALALLLGCLVRIEVFLVLGAATGAMAWLAYRRRLPPRAVLLLGGWAALPVMLIHDYLLAGNPLFWLQVSAVSAAAKSVQPPRQVALAIARVPASLPLVAVAAVGGVVGAWRSERGRTVAIGLATLAVGTAGLIGMVALQHRQVIGHYYSPIRVSMGFSAALAVGFALDAVRRWLFLRWPAAHRRPAVATALLSVIGVVAGVLLLRPLQATPATLASIDTQRAIAANSDAVRSRLREIVAGLGPPPPAVGPLTRPDGSGFQVLVPGVPAYRLAVDLGVSMTAIGSLVPDRKTFGSIHPGVVVYHDAATDRGREVATQFEGASPLTVDGVTFELLFSELPGTWIWRGAAAPGGGS